MQLCSFRGSDIANDPERYAAYMTAQLLSPEQFDHFVAWEGGAVAEAVRDRVQYLRSDEDLSAQRSDALPVEIE